MNERNTIERPILFNPAEVKAILNGRKNQTRRATGLERFNKQPNRWRLEGDLMAFDGGFEYSELPPCPYGRPGVLLSVRETWCAPWFSRLTLRVTAVRVERLQDIDNHDSWREGVPEYDTSNSLWINATPTNKMPDGALTVQACDVFAFLWDSINAKRGYSWDSNPFVWVIEFEIASPTGEDDGPSTAAESNKIPHIGVLKGS